MIYRMKDVIKMGVTAKTIRCYERAKLINTRKTTGHMVDVNNRSHDYREFSEDDMKKIWMIKMLQGIGFNYDEIKEIINNDFELKNKIDLKIEDLNKKIEELNNTLGYAEYIRMTGEIPVYGDEIMNNVSVYTENAKEKWTTKNDEMLKILYDSMACLASNPEIFNYNMNFEEMSQEELKAYLEKMKPLFDNYKWFHSESKNRPIEMAELLCVHELTKFKEYDYKSLKVQLLCEAIHNLYKVQIDISNSDDTKIEILKEFGRAYDHGLMSDIYDYQYDEEQKRYILDAYAFYCGYDSYDDYITKKSV